MSFLNCFSSSSEDEQKNGDKIPPVEKKESNHAINTKSSASLHDDQFDLAQDLLLKVKRSKGGSGGGVLVLSGDMLGSAPTALENEIGLGGGIIANVEPGDDLEVVDSSASDQVPRRRRKKTSKKMFFVWSLVSYTIVCFLFFFTNLSVLIGIWFRKMHYFIREPHKMALFDVIPNVYWILLRSLFGSLIHILLTIFTILILVGIKKTEALVVRHQEKLMLWILVLACVGEFIMLFSTIEHMGSSATVENGQAKDTLLPQNIKQRYHKCFSNNAVFQQTILTETIMVPNQVRANLKWMVQISCGTSTSGHQTLPTWQFILSSLFQKDMLTGDPECRSLKSQLESGAIADCSIVHFLDALVYLWLILDGLGVWFCVGIVYLYFKTFVRTKPGRFSFVDSTYQEDIEALREVAEKVKKFTDRRDQQAYQRSHHHHHSHHHSHKSHPSIDRHRNKKRETWNGK